MKIHKNKITKINKIQTQHNEGTINVYNPIEAYSEEWVHVEDKNGTFIEAYPKEGTRKRSDLPPVATQWQQDYKKRFCKDKPNGKSTRNR